MEGWPTLPSSIVSSLRDEEKYAGQPKPPAKQTENEITLTIQGQRTVQEIVDKATELFRKLQNVRLSDDVASRQSQLQNKDIRDHLNLLKGLLGKLRNTYDETKRAVTVPSGENLQNSIPFEQEGEKDSTMEIHVSGENGALEKEHSELQKKLRAKNEQLKEAIDKMRSVIWDINTMMALKPL